MKLLPRGGFLATASCSHFASEEDFKEAIRKASVLADVKLKLVSATGPSPEKSYQMVAASVKPYRLQRKTTLFKGGFLLFYMGP